MTKAKPAESENQAKRTGPYLIPGPLTRNTLRRTRPLPAQSLAALPLVVIALLLSFSTPATALVIDDFAYTNSTAARAAWRSTGAPVVAMTNNAVWSSNQVMVLPCDFATRSTRCTWDRNVLLNLSEYGEFQLDVFAPNPAAISGFTLYFRAGSGWYGASAAVERTGWQTLRFAVGDFIPEGTPAGWDHIDGIRLSPWKGAAQNTFLAVRELRTFTPTVFLVRDTQSSNPSVVQDTIDRHLAWLGGFNISCGVLSRAGVEAGLLRGSALAILPYNESVSDAEMTALENYVADGGKLLVYYLLPSRLAQLLGLRIIGWTPGDFAAWKFSDPTLPDLPPRVLQSSWNITAAEPNGDWHARVIAEWENAAGQDTGKAAWLASDHGYFMSHILLGDDADKKAFALLCLVGAMVPDISSAASAGAIAQIGFVGPFEDYEDAVTRIRSQGATTLRDTLVISELSVAETERARAQTQYHAGQFSQAILSAQSARSHLKQAYLLSLKPVYPEFRAIWEHHATGPYPGNWAAAIEVLATNQFTAVFPNMLWGGLAHYDSAFLPHSDEFKQYGDQIAACVNAAHARRLQVHVWKVNWNLLGAPQSFIDQMRAANRTQVSRTGAPVDWLCPSHPDNFALETNSMLEVVRNYDVDGIHFDYIRYPDSDSCYCSGCESRFQAATGLTVNQWPADVLAAGSLRNAFLNWRRLQITRLVEAVHVQTKALKPRVQVSAAVFPNATSAYDEVGQDWRLWLTNGLLDFVCPMDYTTSSHTFTNLVAEQLAYAAGKVPVYPGVGAFVLQTDAAVAQIQATRTAKTGGFIVFELSPASAATLLPAIGAGATAWDEPDLDDDSLPDSWETAWFGGLGLAAKETNNDGDDLSDWEEYVAGSDPTRPGGDLPLVVRRQNTDVEVLFEVRGTEALGYRNASRHYRLEETTTLGSNSVWSAVSGLADHVAEGNPVTMSWRIPPQSGGTHFYRLRVWLQQAP